MLRGIRYRRLRRFLGCTLLAFSIAISLFTTSKLLHERERHFVKLKDERMDGDYLLINTGRNAFLVNNVSGSLAHNDPEIVKNPTPLTVSKLTSFPQLKLKNTSVCLADEGMNSSTVNKLGSYPQTKRFLTIGISSIARPAGVNYLRKTVELLIENISEKDKKDVFVVIFLADFDEIIKLRLTEELSTNFNKSIEQGLLHVIGAPRQFYPSLENLKQKYGDSEPRRLWRSKQNIDFAFLMCYCKELSQYYLHLEDDVVPTPSFFPKLREFVSSQNTTWAILDVASMGHVGKVYRAEDLENAASFFYLMFDEMPVDWLIIYWRMIKNEKKTKFNQLESPPASLFQHIGDQSSFMENKHSSRSKEKYFDQYDHKYMGLNPPAIITTSLSARQGSALEAYSEGGGYFWAYHVHKYDSVVVQFETATVVNKIFVDTGSYLAPKDKLKSGVVQASFASSDREPGSCGDYQTIGRFENGQADVALEENKSAICKLQLLVTQNQSNWLFLREIDVWQVS